MSLSRLWQRQGRGAAAYQVLAAVYDWFTEGFDTADLQEAKALLATLKDNAIAPTCGSRRARYPVHSPGEYSGELLHMPDYPPEGALRGGHIPGAANIPWGQAVAPDGTCKSTDDLRALYEGKARLTPTDEVIAYCRIGERSSHTWFFLT